MCNIDHYTLQEFIDNLLEDTESVVDSKPYLAFMILSVIIELLGLCKNGLKLVNGKHADTYSAAISSYKSLAKYNDSLLDLYHGLRCGMLHVGMPQKDLKLCRNHNDLDNKVIGCHDLYDDVQSAWADIKEQHVDDIGKEVLLVEDNDGDSVTGATCTINTSSSRKKK